ncbi:MAG TPA: general secretion pathway protein GspK [Psychromonas hadalis]|nr:general secretion pathway protein GspK [Psychromonas hadalis]
MRLSLFKKQKGVALITVLMILAIMVAVAAGMTGRLVASLKRTEGLVHSQGAYWYAQAAADMGEMVLDDDFADSKIVSLDQNWATPDMVFPLDNGSIAGTLKDMRSCFNVNALRAPDKEGKRPLALKQFQALLEALSLDDYRAEMIADSTRDWIDKEKKSSGAQGAEDDFYSGLRPAYLTGNQLMIDISELRTVQGVGVEIFKRISPYLCAIPSDKQLINVNTIAEDQPQILQALFEGDDKETPLSVDNFKELLKDRPTSGWESVDKFLAEPALSSVEVSDELKKQLRISSDFFQLNGTIEFEDRLLSVKLLFKVENKKSKMIRYQSGGLGAQ